MTVNTRNCFRMALARLKLEHLNEGNIQKSDKALETSSGGGDKKTAPEVVSLSQAPKVGDKDTTSGGGDDSVRKQKTVRLIVH